MYVRIANESSDVNRLFLEKLGISTKRDNEDTIGQFGSGSKFAPIAALRRDWSWLNAGNDANGSYRMHYEIEDTDGIAEVFFVYNDGIRKPSSYTAEAGSLSWEDSFQIVREALANAIDEFVENGSRWWWELVDEPLDEEGVFSVFIRDEETWNPPPEIMNVLENFDEYFCINRTSRYETDHGKMFERDTDSPDGLIFHKGVRVHEFESDDYGNLLWDYELDRIVLNEERRVRDAHNISNQIGQIISSFDEIALIKEYITADPKCYEQDMIGTYSLFPGYPALWLEAWRDLHGEKIIPVSDPTPKFVLGRLKLKGYRTVDVSQSVRYILDNAGTPSIRHILSGEEKFDVRKKTEGDEKHLQKALTLIQGAGITIDNMITLFDPIPDEQDYIWGAVIGETIFINYELMRAANLKDLVGTLIHENDHIESELSDEDETFRHIADNLIGRLIIENYS